MAGLIHLVLRGVQALFGLIVLGLGAGAAAQWHTWIGYGTPSQTAFGIFLGIWTLLVAVYFLLHGRIPESVHHPFVRLAVDALTMLFWFAGFIALAVLASAFAYDDYFFDDGSAFDGWVRFDHLTAAMAAFGGFEWLLFVATTVMTALDVFRGKSHRSTHAAANPEVHV